MADETKTERKKIDPERLAREVLERPLLLVQGSAMPVPGPTNKLGAIMPADLRTDSDCTERGSWFFHYRPELPPPMSGVVALPRAAKFQVRHEAMLGTVEELVAKYRENLTRMLEIVMQGEHEGNEADSAALQESARAQFGYRPGKAISVPFDESHPTVTDFHAARLAALRAMRAKS